MIVGIVLAGGQSQRMGRPKATLKAGDETFLERAVRVLKEGGCRDVVVVLNTDDPALIDLTSGSGARSAGGGGGPEQIDSLRAGVQALPSKAEAAVVLPVDHPLVQPASVAALIGAFRSSGAAIARACYAARHGHPVLFGAAVFDELLHGNLPEGARSVVRAHAEGIEEVEVDDPGVLIDVDTPEDYEEHFGGGLER
jgi:molybdenum cofactor cytidylyltransferase